ncbi:hypothetical protein BTE48_16965, partial [Oceanospirillum multiglobuliferum]
MDVFVNTSAPLLQPRNLGSGYLVKIFVFFLLGCSIAMSAHAGGIELQDDLNNKVVLPQPAQRIVSLAPSVTELLFSAGAGSKVVAAVDYSDFPEEAKTLP